MRIGARLLTLRACASRRPGRNWSDRVRPAPTLAAVLECVINVSEGRDMDRLLTIARACGPSLIDVHTDPDHHRSVFTLAALARAVPRVRLGTLVLLEALRPAAVLAKALATVDCVSGGRLDVGDDLIGVAEQELRPRGQRVETILPRQTVAPEVPDQPFHL